VTGTAGRAIAAAMSATYEIVPVAHSKGEYWVYLAVPGLDKYEQLAVTQLFRGDERCRVTDIRIIALFRNHMVKSL
jgi:hypothetical protein